MQLCGRQDSNLHGLFAGWQGQRPAHSRCAVYTNFTTPARRVVGAGGTVRGERFGGVAPHKFLVLRRSAHLLRNSAFIPYEACSQHLWHQVHSAFVAPISRNALPL